MNDFNTDIKALFSEMNNNVEIFADDIRYIFSGRGHEEEILGNCIIRLANIAKDAAITNVLDAELVVDASHLRSLTEINNPLVKADTDAIVSRLEDLGTLSPKLKNIVKDDSLSERRNECAYFSKMAETTAGTELFPDSLRLFKETSSKYRKEYIAYFHIALSTV